MSLTHVEKILVAGMKNKADIRNYAIQRIRMLELEVFQLKTQLEALKEEVSIKKVAPEEESPETSLAERLVDENLDWSAPVAAWVSVTATDAAIAIGFSKKPTRAESMEISRVLRMRKGVVPSKCSRRGRLLLIPPAR